MAATRNMQKEIEALKKEIASLRANQTRWKRKAEAVSANGSDFLGGMRDDIADRVKSIKDTITGGASDAVDEIADQLDDLRSTIEGYSSEAERTVTAHPLAAVAGAIAVGYLIGRLTPVSGDTVSAILRQARALWRAESLIAEIRLRALLRQTVSSMLAALIAVFGLGMLDLAGYLALTPIWGEVLAAVGVAVADFVVAVLIIIVGGRPASSAELTLATELRDQAMEGIELEARNAVDGMTGFVRRPAELAGTASSLLLAIVNGFLKGRARKGDG